MDIIGFSPSRLLLNRLVKLVYYQFKCFQTMHNNNNLTITEIINSIKHTWGVALEVDNCHWKRKRTSQLI